MKSIIVPEVSNIYKTMFELINLFNSIKQVRLSQESFKLTNEEKYKEIYKKYHAEMNKQIERVNNFCTPLEFLSDWLKTKIDECNQLDLIEKTIYSNKNYVHDVCRSHYPTINNAPTFNSIHLKALNNQFLYYELLRREEELIQFYRTSKNINVQVHYDCNYNLLRIIWQDSGYKVIRVKESDYYKSLTQV